MTVRQVAAQSASTCGKRALGLGRHRLFRQIWTCGNLTRPTVKGHHSLFREYLLDYDSLLLD